VLERIEASSAKLSDVQTDFGEYLDGVSAVLAKSSQAFQEAVTSTLQRVNGDFHDQLDRAVKLLKSSIEDFGETLENAGSGH
jgi:predicted trehalose synthase